MRLFIDTDREDADNVQRAVDALTKALRAREISTDVQWYVNEIVSFAREVLSSEGKESDHIAEFRDEGWSLQHPPECRPNLIDCEVHRLVEQFATERGPLVGRFKVELASGDIKLLFTGDDRTEIPWQPDLGTCRLCGRPRTPGGGCEGHC